MTDIQNNEPIDEAAMDAELQKSIDEVKAGKTLEVTPQGQTGETGASGDNATGEAGANATGETGPTGEGDGNPQPGDNKDGEFRIPNQGKFESDEAYEKRVELFDLVKRRKAATTPEAKQAISEEISKTKGELRSLGESDKNYTPPGKPSTETVVVEDPTVKADRERLKALGGLTKEDIANYVREERMEQEVRSDVSKFVNKYPEFKDADVREVFFNFVDNNYVWQGKSGKDLTATLELARDAMFRPSESIQDRVLRGADVQGKVNAMQFPGGPGSGKVAYSPEMKKSIDELKSAGMSEEKALELLSD